EVGAGDLHEPDADELVGGGGDFGVETDDLPVDLGGVPSGFAPEHEEDRLAGALGLGLRGGEVGVPAELGRVGLLAALGVGSGGLRPRQCGKDVEACSAPSGCTSIQGPPWPGPPPATVPLRASSLPAPFSSPFFPASPFLSTSSLTTRARSSATHSSRTRLFS